MSWPLLICFAVLSSWLAGCRTTPQPETDSPADAEAIQRSQPLLGTFVTITAYGDNHDQTQQAVTAAFEEIRRVDLLLSIHKPESETARLNVVAADGPFEISAELHSVLATSLEIARLTDGAFDPTIGPLAHLWGFIWKEYRLPTKVELARTLPLIGYQQIRLDTNIASGTPAVTVSFARRGMSLDFGGIGKGYAVDRAVDTLRKRGINNAMVKAGGDLRVIGAPPGKDAWEVQLEDPRKQGERTAIRLRDRALSTSGNYENFFEVEGRRYSHIINPRTGYPIEGTASCTVIAPTCIASDAYATAFFILGAEDSLRRFGDQFQIRIVDTNLRVLQTPTFPQ